MNGIKSSISGTVAIRANWVIVSDEHHDRYFFVPDGYKLVVKNDQEVAKGDVLMISGGEPISVEETPGY